MSNSQQLDCQKFKLGHFQGTDPLYGITKVERTENTHKEILEEFELELIFDITWIDDCTYELKLREIVGDEELFNYSKDVVFTVRIVETGEKSFVIEGFSDEPEPIYRNELFSIE